jgi:hypothetical protein
MTAFYFTNVQKAYSKGLEGVPNVSIYLLYPKPVNYWFDVFRFLRL